MRVDAERRAGESRAVIREIHGSVLCGAACFLLVIGFLFATRGDVRGLVLANPALGLLLGFGALTSFAPLVICIAIESVPRGDQVTPADTPD
jgi:hypothetical protein